MVKKKKSKWYYAPDFDGEEAFLKDSLEELEERGELEVVPDKAAYFGVWEFFKEGEKRPVDDPEMIVERLFDRCDLWSAWDYPEQTDFLLVNGDTGEKFVYTVYAEPAVEFSVCRKCGEDS